MSDVRRERFVMVRVNLASFAVGIERQSDQRRLECTAGMLAALSPQHQRQQDQGSRRPGAFGKDSRLSTRLIMDLLLLAPCSLQKTLENLTHLDLFNNPLGSEEEDYRNKVFKLLPSLKFLDGADVDNVEDEDSENEEALNGATEEEDEEEEEDADGEGEEEEDGEEDVAGRISLIHFYMLFSSSRSH